MTQINVNKSTLYGVETPLLGAVARKINLYAVEMVPLYLEAQKIALYAAELPDATGNAKQATAADRPIYRAGPEPYVEFGTGDSLAVNIMFADTYTIVTYRADDTFTVQSVSLPAGPTTLNANFNQVAIIRGTLSRIALASIKRTMRQRAGVGI